MASKQESKMENDSEFDVRTCMAMMGRLVSEHMEACDCAEMMSQIAGQEDIPEDWMRVMSRMMEVHFETAEGGSQ